MRLLAWIALAALVFWWLRSLDRRLTLLELHAVAGELRFLRGRCPPELLQELQDVLRRQKATGKWRLRLERGAALWVCDQGSSPETDQRLRNVVGRFALPRLRYAPEARPLG